MDADVFAGKSPQKIAQITEVVPGTPNNDLMYCPLQFIPKVSCNINFKVIKG